MDVKLISLLILFTLNEPNIHSKLEKNMEKEHYVACGNVVICNNL